jgi:hypothetical protein
MSQVITTITAQMQAFEAPKVASMKGRIKTAANNRAAYELEKRQGVHSKDFDCVRDLCENDDVARFFLAIGVNPEAYINSPSYDPAEFERKSGIPAVAKTGNLKAYKKMKETAEYFARAAKLEKVLKTFVACAIISARYHVVIPRDVCVRFLNSVPLNRVSDELIEALEHFRAKHMSGGADTQTSQCTLQLANMRAASLVMNGRFKDFALDVNSPVIESFAERFNLTAELEKAREYRASLDNAPETFEGEAEEEVLAEA